MIQWWLQPLPKCIPWESPSTPGLLISSLETRPCAESRRPKNDANFATGAGGLAPSGLPKGTDFWRRARGGEGSASPAGSRGSAPKLPHPISLGLYWKIRWRVSSPEPRRGGSRAAGATGNLGPGGVGRARPTRAASLVAAPTRRDSASPRAPRNLGSRPAGPGGVPLTLETLGGLRGKH